MAEPVSEQASGLPEEEFSALMQSIGGAAPLLRGLLGSTPPQEKQEALGASAPVFQGENCQRREALLCALKPYLSPARCEAVDYLIRLWRVGDALRALR